MLGGVIPLIAKVGIPIVANLIQSAMNSEPQKVTIPANTDKPTPSLEKQLATRYDVKNMSKKDFAQMLTTMHQAGRISSTELSQLNASLEKLDSLNTADSDANHDFMSLFKQQLNQTSPFSLERQIAEKGLDLVNGLNALRASTISHRA
jgi:uncharacterized membrane protein YgaE (UPF0421/DUF939 family)